MRRTGLVGLEAAPAALHGACLPVLRALTDEGSVPTVTPSLSVKFVLPPFSWLIRSLRDVDRHRSGYSAGDGTRRPARTSRACWGPGAVLHRAPRAAGVPSCPRIRAPIDPQPVHPESGMGPHLWSTVRPPSKSAPDMRIGEVFDDACQPGQGIHLWRLHPLQPGQMRAATDVGRSPKTLLSRANASGRSSGRWPPWPTVRWAPVSGRRRRARSYTLEKGRSFRAGQTPTAWLVRGNGPHR